MTMFKRIMAATALAAGAFLTGVPAAFGTELILGGPWTILDQQMQPGEYFLAPDGGIQWTFRCPADHCKIQITDLYVISDRFEVYDNGVLIATTPLMPDWDALGFPGPGVGGGFPPWTPDPDIAFASGLYSSAVIYVGNGAHSIAIRDIHIPPVAIGGGPFPDGTVAFRVMIPEPATLALLGMAFVAFGVARRRPG